MQGYPNHNTTCSPVSYAWRRERKYYNRKSKEVEELRLIYNFFGFSVERFSLPSRKRTKLVSALCFDLRNPASTQMIDGTEKPKIPFKFAKRVARYNKFDSNCLKKTKHLFAVITHFNKILNVRNHKFAFGLQTSHAQMQVKTVSIAHG